MRRSNIRGFLLLVLFVVAAWQLAPVFLSDVSLPTPNQSPSQPQYIYLTPEPLPTYTPAPTYTPYPTQTPIPAKIIYTSDADSAYRTWMPRILMMVIVGLCFWIVYNHYQLKRDAVEKEHQLRMAEIEMQAEFARSQAVANTPQVRPLNFNVHRGNGEEKYLVTAFNKKIPHSKVSDFIENVDTMGLSINQWRTEMQWAQVDIEDLLDHLEAIQLINPRSKGSAATWRREVDKETLARMLGVVL